MSPFPTIARNTFRQSLREPIFLILTLAGLSAIGLLPGIAIFTFREHEKLITDSAMAVMLVFGWVLAVLSASHVVAREIENGTALLVLAKPVRRPVFLLAKLMGVGGALCVFWFLASVAVLMALRVATDQFWLDMRIMGLLFGAILLGCGYGGLRNYLSKNSFPMHALVGMAVTLPLAAAVAHFLPKNGAAHPLAWKLLPALVLLLFAILAMTALSTAFSTRLNWTSNLALCTALFLTGMMSDYLLGRHVAGNPGIGLLYAVTPNWQQFWMADALAAGAPVPWTYVALAAGYFLLYTALAAELGILLFAGREVADTRPEM